MAERTNDCENEQEYNRRLVELYLKYGSLDEVYRKLRYDVKVSPATYYRLLDQWGIIKLPQHRPHTELAEILYFFHRMSTEDVPLERMYSQMNYSFETSRATLHRVARRIRKGVFSRTATAVVLTPENDPYSVLVGNDISAARLEIGKRVGSLTIPAGFTPPKDARNGIIRVLQREAFTDITVDKNFPYEIIPEEPRAFMHLFIADVAVSVYHLKVPEYLEEQVSSFVLNDLRYVFSNEISSLPQNEETIRRGVIEMVRGYEQSLDSEERAPLIEVSPINLALNPTLARSFA
jgi:hypothetical protein